MISLKVVQPRCISGTFRSTNATTHTVGRLDLGLAVNVAERRSVWTNFKAGHTGNTLVLIDVRDLGADVQVRFREYRSGPRRSGRPRRCVARHPGFLLRSDR